MAGSPERVEALAAHRTYRPDGFLPHGTAKDGAAAEQPIYLTVEADNPNVARLLILCDGAERADVDAFPLVCEMFDGNDDGAVTTATRPLEELSAGRPSTGLLPAIAGRQMGREGKKHVRVRRSLNRTGHTHEA